MLVLKKDSDFNNWYINIKGFLTERSNDDQLNEESFGDDLYTPHDSTHCSAVETIVDYMLSLCDPGKLSLTELEKFILLASIWSHDLGMLTDISNKYFAEFGIKGDTSEKRKQHDLISSWYLSKNYKTLLLGNSASGPDTDIKEGNLRSYVYVINNIIKYHRRATNVDQCPENIFLNGELVRWRLLACLLRLGDTLHIDSSRYTDIKYNIIQLGDFDRFARLHWLKSFIVSNIYLDKEHQLVQININLPDINAPYIEIGKDCDLCGKCVDSCSNGILVKEDNVILVKSNISCSICEECIKKCPKDAIKILKNDWKDNLDNLKLFISNDIQEDLMAVSETFINYKMPIYSSVKCNVNYIPGYDRFKAREVIGVINDLDLIFSPNSSRVIRKSLDSIHSLSQTPFKSKKAFLDQLGQLINLLKKTSRERPCHVGLRTIINDLVVYQQSVQNNDDKLPLEELTKLANNIRNKRSDFQKKIYTPEKMHKVLDNKNNIFLFAYSDMVKDLLEKYSSLNRDFLKSNIYIFEGGTKRRYTSNNLLEYHDGLHYSFQLKRIGFENVIVIPDLSFATLINLFKIEDGSIKRSILLFGVNGIDKATGDFAHSSGHLSLAIIADKLDVDICVVADSFKLGEIDWDLKATRNTHWITGQKNLIKELDEKQIKLINYKEDRIDKNLVDYMLSDYVDDPKKF